MSAPHEQLRPQTRIPGLTIQDILIQYQSRLRNLETAISQARVHSNIAEAALVVAFAMFLILGVWAAGRQIAPWLPLVPVPVTLASARRYRIERQSRYRSSRLAQLYRRAIDRIGGNWSGSGATGEEFSLSEHAYASDLNLFGEGSLFELLSTARTAVGRKGLAGYLLAAPPVSEIVERQQAIAELRTRTDLRERVALLGDFDLQETKWETFAEWLDSPRAAFSRMFRMAALVSSTLLATLLLGGLTALIPWPRVAVGAAPLLAFHSVAGLINRRRVNRAIEWVRPLSAETQVLRGGLRLLEETEFASPKLRRLSAQARHAWPTVRRLERFVNALHERNKEWFYLPSLALLIGTQLLAAIEDWRTKHGAQLTVWLDAWAEFEALNSLANYAHENPENTVPEFVSDSVRFEADALGHPLIPDDSCVRNSVRLNDDSRFLVISGSNMSGKSTLLRAIGLNAVLACAGAPVRARSLRLSRLDVCASLSVVDSLAAGKSKFLAEIDRLRHAIESASSGAGVLFLVDEILSGTNSGDRRIAAEAIVRTLLGSGAIGAVSTHDLALTEIADLDELYGVNVHMGSYPGGGPLDFDYVLRPGPSRESNALAIARLAGVPIGFDNPGTSRLLYP
jgi:ABC-type multidrug transport system fused ATPase/permease subunit